MVKGIMGRNKRSGDAPAGGGSRLAGSVFLLLLTTAGCDSPAEPDSPADPFTAEGPAVVRQGEVAAYSVRTLDEGAPIPQVTWSLLPPSGGFITPEGGERDCFVHHSAIQGKGFKSLTEGERVEFDIVTRDKGPSAENVVRLDA